jgi:hypothetical protein
MNNSVALVAVTGLLVSFGLPLFLVAIILIYKQRKLRMVHETVAKLVEKGLPVPPGLLDPPQHQSGPMRGGLVLIALGIALAIFLTEVGGPWSIGLIPGLMGVALLLAWMIEKNQPR